MSSSGESLKRALEVLNLSPDDFLTLLNAEMDDDESKVSASTMHRWLSGFTPALAPGSWSVKIVIQQGEVVRYLAVRADNLGLRQARMAL